MLTMMKKKEEDWDKDTLINRVSESDEVKLTSVKEMLSESKKRKKSSEMLIMNKTSCLINHDDLLMNIKVLES